MKKWKEVLLGIPIAELRKLMKVAMTVTTGSTKSIFLQNIARAFRGTGRVLQVGGRVKTPLAMLEGAKERLIKELKKGIRVDYTGLFFC